jgi:hypothetical protein
LRRQGRGKLPGVDVLIPAWSLLGSFLRPNPSSPTIMDAKQASPLGLAHTTPNDTSLVTSSLLSPEPITFASQRRDIQCKNRPLPSLPHHLSSSSSSLSLPPTPTRPSRTNALFTAVDYKRPTVIERSSPPLVSDLRRRSDSWYNHWRRR